jgi:hypothetical protein
MTARSGETPDPEELDATAEAIASTLQEVRAIDGGIKNGQAKERLLSGLKARNLPDRRMKLIEAESPTVLLHLGDNHTFRQRAAAMGIELPSTDRGAATGAVGSQAAAEPMYATAQKVVPAIVAASNRDAYTFITAPANDDEIAKDVNIDQGVKRVLGKDGHFVRANHYSIEKGVDDLKDKIGQRIAEFNTAVNTDKRATTRWAIRVLSTRDKAAIVAFLRQELGRINNGDEKAVELAMSKVRMIVIGYEKGQRMNPVIDLFVDFGMMELDRYGKPGEYVMLEADKMLMIKSDVARLLRESTTNLDGVNAGNVEDYLKKIFEGVEVLRIRAIDWKSMQDWKDRQDAVLTSL